MNGKALARMSLDLLVLAARAVYRLGIWQPEHLDAALEQLDGWACPWATPWACRWPRE